MKRYIWGGSTLALLLLFSAVLGPQPFHLADNNPGGPQFWPSLGQHGFRAHAEDRDDNNVKTRAQIAAKDMAVTTALCLRDCRYALQDLANHLDHSTDTAQWKGMLQQTLRLHPQFRSIVLHSPDGQKTTAGSPVHEPRVGESIDGVRKTNQYYVTDIYQGNSSNQMLMSMAVPLLHNSQTSGVLAAEVEMSFLHSVADQVDSQMGTHSVLLNHDGSHLPLHPERTQAMSGNQPSAEHGVDGTKWKTSAFHIRSTASDNHRPRRLTNEVVVQFENEPDAQTLAKIQSDIQGTIVKRNHLPAFVFRSDSLSTDQLQSYFQKMGVKFAEPHRVYRQNEHPNDELYQRYQWNFPQMNIEKGWSLTTGNPQTVIAVVDTGVDLDHPEFQGQLVPGRNIIAGNDRPQDDNGHGTHVSGVIVARTNNVEGVAGMNWSSRVMPIKALDAQGSGSAFDIADGIRWAADHGAKVVNLSLGEYEDSNYLRQAIQYAESKDVLVVAAMGNDDTDQPSYPAAYPGVLAVAAVDENGQRASFSNYGKHTGVAAPGVSIPSTYPDHRYAAMSGTSMASPHVAGLAGLVRAANPNLNASQVRDIIQRTASDIGTRGRDRYYGSGLINVASAVQAAQAQAKGDQNKARPVRKAPWWWPFRWNPWA